MFLSQGVPRFPLGPLGIVEAFLTPLGLPRDLVYPVVFVLYFFLSQGLRGDPVESLVRAGDPFGWHALGTSIGLSQVTTIIQLLILVFVSARIVASWH